MDFDSNQKKALLKLARESIESFYNKKEVDLSLYSEFSTPMGVFVTLKINGVLRGCIGYSQGYHPLNESIFKAARAAAFEDSRFDPVSKDEFKNVTIELSVLTTPKLITVKGYSDYITKIDIGSDGLILEYGPNSGLLLPQVPGEQGWDVKEYLENLCYKAGISKYDWKEPGIKISKFQAIVFSE
jgi:AmmeMemoRadiSam system protein A